MVRCCLLLMIATSLALSGGAAGVAATFVDVSATDGYTQAIPTGVCSGGAVLMQGVTTAVPSYYYETYLYPGGTSGTMTDIMSQFTANGKSCTRTISSAMNDNGQATIGQVAQQQVGWLYSGGTAGTATTFSLVYSGVNTAYDTQTLGIDDNGDLGGQYRESSGSDPVNAFVRVGAVNYFLNAPGNVGAPSVTALNTNGQAAGWDNPNQGLTHALVWSYTISGGSLISQTATDLQSSGLAAAYPSVMSSQALAINSSGMVVVGASNSVSAATPTNDSAYFLYNMSSKSYTSLGSLMLYDPFVSTLDYNGGHEQAIDNAGQVVGRIDVSGNGSGDWHAAIWQNGAVTDLNTEYAGILPAGFTMTMATAIDNEGDIAGWGTDASGNTDQAFVITNARLPGDANGDGRVDVNDLTIVLSHFGQTGATWAQGEFTGDGTVDVNDLTIVLAHFGQTAGASAGPPAAVPEPCALALLIAGLAGLLAFAWRKLR